MLVFHGKNCFVCVQTEMVRQQLEDTKKEYELKLDEYARLLDIRAARIKACYK